MGATITDDCFVGPAVITANNGTCWNRTRLKNEERNNYKKNAQMPIIVEIVICIHEFVGKSSKAQRVKTLPQNWTTTLLKFKTRRENEMSMLIHH